MKLLELRLKYFKGSKNFTMEPRGKDVDIYGDNGTGKTTIADAVNWLLFDKDTQNKKGFAIKTLDSDGNVLHGLDHSVEGVFDLGDKTISLCKVYFEQWTKKRGTATKEFTGHAADYFIDSVPIKEKEYKAKIAEICSEDAFKLLTSPGYFSEQLHWEKRRAILLGVCGDLTDEEVIASDKALAKLPGILNGRSLEDHKKVIAARRTAINKELEKIPVRIDEVTKSLPDISELDIVQLPKDIAKLQAAIRDKEQELSRIESGGEISEKRLQLREIEGELLRLQNEFKVRTSSKVDAKRQELSGLKDKCLDLRDSINSLTKRRDNSILDVIAFEKKLDVLRGEYTATQARQFTFEQDDTCPTCGQSLPQEKLAAARDKALAQFNQQKANDLETNITNGKRHKDAMTETQEEISRLEKEIKESNVSLADYEKLVTDRQTEIDAMLKDAGDISTDAAYVKLLQKQEFTEDEIRKLQQGNVEAAGAVKQKIERLGVALLSMQTSLARVGQVEQGKKRIAELREQERALAAEYEKLEGELFLTEQFVKTKVSMLEEKINSKFKMARFKLFDVQVNGGINECCETTYQGVPYSSGLNNGHKNAVGMDIINTLSEHYNFYPPIFVDNAESITVLPEMKAQVIRLVVNKDDKALRVEIAEPAEANLFKEAI